MTSFDVLLPPGPPLSTEELIERWPIRGLAVNMVASLDGRIAVDGGATALGGEGDRALFLALRRSVDGVLAGTNTVRVERYGPLKATMLFITRSGDIPWDAPLFEAPEQRVLIAGPATVPSRVRARVKVLDAGEPIAAFRANGIETILCEGGPTLNGALLADGVVDELFVTIDPSLRGGDGLRLVEGMVPVTRGELRWVLRHGDELLLRYRFRPHED